MTIVAFALIFTATFIVQAVVLAVTARDDDAVRLYGLRIMIVVGALYWAAVIAVVLS